MFDGERRRSEESEGSEVAKGEGNEGAKGEGSKRCREGKGEVSEEARMRGVRRMGG